MTQVWFAFEVTFRCNLKCAFCYNPWLESTEKPGAELSRGDFAALADSMVKGGNAAGVTLTGGEPLLRDDLPEIAEVFAGAGLRVAVATNGSLLTARRAREMACSGVQHFDIGFTSPSSQTLMALTHGVKAGCSVAASICIHRNSFEDTGLRVRTAAAMGADSVCLNRFIPTGRGMQNATSLTPGRNDLMKSLELAQKAAEACPIHIYAGIPFSLEPEEKAAFPAIEFTECRCGDTKWAVDCAGNLRTCEQNGKIICSLLNTSFPDALEKHAGEIEKFRRSARSGCRFLPPDSFCGSKSS